MIFYSKKCLLENNLNEIQEGVNSLDVCVFINIKMLISILNVVLRILVYITIQM